MRNKEIFELIGKEEKDRIINDILNDNEVMDELRNYAKSQILKHVKAAIRDEVSKNDERSWNSTRVYNEDTKVLAEHICNEVKINRDEYKEYASEKIKNKTKSWVDKRIKEMFD